MIDLDNLIDYLPYYYKDRDTYKVNGKGILERFLDICGSYFKNYPLKDIEDFFDSLNDLEKVPSIYLPLYWEFLGKLPFINTPILDQTVATTNFSNYQSVEEVITNSVTVPLGSSPFLKTLKVRDILKYTIALFKIRGSKQFFEILFNLYGLDIKIDDNMGSGGLLPTKDASLPPVITVNHGTQSQEVVPVYDNDVRSTINNFDGDYHYDEMVECTSCLPVNFKVTMPKFISGPGIPDPPPFWENRYRDSVEKLINYFLPYNAHAIIDFVGGGVSPVLSQVLLDNTTDGILSPGNPLPLKVVMERAGDMYQVNTSFDDEYPTTGWSEDINLQDNPVVLAKFISDNLTIKDIRYWIRASGSNPEDFSKHSSILIKQQDTRTTYLLSYKIKDSKGNEVTNPVINLDNREFEVEVTLIKQIITRSSDGTTSIKDYPGYLIDANDGSNVGEVTGSKDNYELKYIFKVNRGGTFKFYASNDPATGISFTIGQDVTGYGVKLIPDTIYINNGKFYRDKDLKEQVTETNLIVYDSLPGSTGDVMVPDQYAIINDVTSSDTQVSSSDIKSGIETDYPDGIKSGDNIPLSLLKIPTDVVGEPSVDLEFKPKEDSSYTIIGHLVLKFVDTSVKLVDFGIYENGNIYHSQQDRPNPDYSMNETIIFAVQFEGTEQAIQQRIAQLDSSDLFTVEFSNGEKVGFNTDMGNGIWITDRYALESDTVATLSFDTSKSIPITVKPEEESEPQGMPWFVCDVNNLSLPIWLVGVGTTLIMGPNGEPIPFRFEGRIYEGGTNVITGPYEVTDLNKIEDDLGNTYEAGEVIRLTEPVTRTYKISTDKGTFTFQVINKAYQPTVESIVCTPSVARLDDAGQATTVVSFVLDYPSNESGWNTYELYDTVPQGLAPTGIRYNNGQQFSANAIGEYHFKVSNDSQTDSSNIKIATFTVLEKLPEKDPVINITVPPATTPSEPGEGEGETETT